MKIEQNIALAPYTTFKIGGPAEYFVRVSSEEGLVEAVRFAKEHELPVTVLGSGSNVLVSDSGVRGLVVKNEIGGVEFSDEGVYAGAGVVFDELVREAVSRGLWGLENLSGIPGTVGATPIQNVGAYGVEVADVISSVRVFDLEREEMGELSPAECGFSYRHSMFKERAGERYIVCGVAYRLSASTYPQLSYKDLEKKFGGREGVSLAEIREAVLAVRRGKFPDWHKVGTAGSFFHNPVVSRDKYAELREKYPGLPGFPEGDGVKIALSWFLDKVLKLKGVVHGPVGTYEKHVLVVVNCGGACADDVEAFAKEIQQKVFDAINVRVEWEVTKL